VGRLKGSRKEFVCLKCSHCKTKVFETVTDLSEWCDGRCIKPNANWIDAIFGCGKIRLIWCNIQTDQFCSHGFSPRNANPIYTTNPGEMDDCIRAIIITNQNKKTFIPNCRYGDF